MKKIMALALMLMMFLSTVGFAAISSSGSKSSPAPSSSSSSKPSTPAPAPSTSKTAPTGGEYKPSAPASSYSDKAPAKQPAPGVQPNTQPPQQPSGNSFWRNASLFGGGMLAGSMLGHLFGSSGNSMGGGGFSLFGMIINLLIIGGIIQGVRYLWNKYQNNNRNMR